MINFPEYENIIEQNQVLITTIDCQNDLEAQKKLKASNAEIYQKEIELIVTNNWVPEQKINIIEDKKEITNPVEKLKNIIKSFNELHIKQVEQSGKEEEIFNLVQHLFSFEDEMNN